MTTNTLALKPGSRLRTGGTTYEVTENAHIPAGVVPVVPQAARLLKVFCESCGYTCRITQRWITKAGAPECPSGHGDMVVAVKAEKVEKAPAPAPKAAPVELIDELEEVLAELAAAETPKAPATEDTSGSVLADLLSTL